MEIIHKYFKNLSETQIEQFSKLQDLYKFTLLGMQLEPL